MTSADSQHATIQSRKVDHIELCAREEVEFRLKRTLLHEVHFVHNPMPQIAVDEIDTSVEVFGKKLRAPIVITGMTGGAEKARDINRMLAEVAEESQIAFGVGSQRAMLVRPETTSTYQVRDIAPTATILGNIGVVQARDMSTQAAEDLVGAIGADALCVHVNPAQEMIQIDGDRDFRGCFEALARLAEELSIPVIMKETGCGLSPQAILRARASGVSAFDISGAGGTTWVGVEVLRAKEGRRVVGEDFWEWGNPTGAVVAAAYAELEALGKADDTTLIASGGIRSGLDVAKAIGLGATLGGAALPFLRAVDAGGVPLALKQVQRFVDGVETAMLLTGSRDLAGLRRAPKVLGPDLRQWVAALR